MYYLGFTSSGIAWLPIRASSVRPSGAQEVRVRNFIQPTQREAGVDISRECGTLELRTWFLGVYPRSDRK